ncbi:BTB/POZ domain-containing protein [Colletotrichum higginsianum]|nr:BTB/POZ domain-containing protein [Colletotrichum higginsianum]
MADNHRALKTVLRPKTRRRRRRKRRKRRGGGRGRGGGGGGGWLPVEIEQDYNPTRAVVDGDPATDRNVFIRDQAAVRNDLFLHLRVYVMADKFAVPALKLLARDRFYRAAELAWDVADEFPDVVDELYTNTPDTDVDMRGIVCRLVGNNVFDDRVRERLEPVMRKHGDFAVGMLKHVIAERKERW